MLAANPATVLHPLPALLAALCALLRCGVPLRALLSGQHATNLVSLLFHHRSQPLMVLLALLAESCARRGRCVALLTRLLQCAHLRSGLLTQGSQLRLVLLMDRLNPGALRLRSEERRVGKECRSRWSRYH